MKKCIKSKFNTHSYVVPSQHSKRENKEEKSTPQLFLSVNSMNMQNRKKNGLANDTYP